VITTCGAYPAHLTCGPPPDYSTLPAAPTPTVATSAPAAQTTPPSSGLAFTGVDILALVLLGCVVIAAGWTFLLAGRKRHGR
jgi:hypothetical protein